MLIVILHHEVASDATDDDRDVLVQVDVVARALQALGHRSHVLPCSLNLLQMQQEIQTIRPSVVFNLVESLGRTDRLAALAPMVLEALGQAYTGAPAEALWITTSKLATKARLRAAGLPTPDWYSAEHALPLPVAPRYILKAVYEHASFGLDDQAVVRVDSQQDLATHLQRFQNRVQRLGFAEEFIEGREFNLSLLGGPDTVEVLPPAEICFEGFAADQLRIVGYRAKWSAESPEYIGTPRRFDFPATDRPLLELLCDLARRCWHEFQLRGYARVDFRVDQRGQPWILEINANPCLSPDAGYAAALERAGISFVDAVQRILDHATPESVVRGDA